MWRALAAIGQELPEDVRVVVLTGEGKSFSAGLDRRMFAEGIEGEQGLASLALVDEATCDATIASYQEAFLWWSEVPAVTIAAVHGHAIGAGFQLALACDLLVAADNSRFAMKEVALGLVPDLAGTQPLVHRVGPQRALEMCLTGREVSGVEASEIGLALLSVPEQALSATVDDLVTAITAAMPNATTAILQLLRDAHSRSHREQTVAERTAQRGRIVELAQLLQK